jgi:hypothetical protein
MEENGIKNLVIQKILLKQTELTHVFVETCFGTEFRVVISSAEWFGTEFQVFAYIFVPFRGTEFRVVFSSTEWFRTEFRAFASNFVPWFRNPSIFLHCRNFLFRGTAGISLEQTNCPIYSVFRGTICRKLPTLTANEVPVRIQYM